MRPNRLLWGAMAAAVFLISGCSTTAYKQYLVARDEYHQCVKRSQSSGARCVPERENLDGALGKYEREAESNYWWRNAIENEREKDPLYHFDRKPK
jgi:hypothetical protein